MNSGSCVSDVSHPERDRLHMQRTPHLFVPCFIDQLFPETGIAAMRLLRHLGCNPIYLPEQTCCGQPAFNAGYDKDAAAVAQHFIEVFQDAEEIVSLSGSCATMVKMFYKQLNIPMHMRSTIDELSRKTFEITDYIVNNLNVSDVGAEYYGRIAYHDSCHLLRELRIEEPPRTLLRNVRGITLVELDLSDRCCGFGGLFSVNYPEISISMGEEKLQSIVRSGSELIVGCDTSCLLHIQGIADAGDVLIKTQHIVEFLAENLRG